MPRYLITCSNSKIEPKGHPNSKPSSIEELSFNNELGKIRNSLINKVLLRYNHFNFDWNNTLPAWQLYSGPHSTIFKRINQRCWENPNTDVLIFSTVFGWVKHTDRLPHYSLGLDRSLIIDDSGSNGCIDGFWSMPQIQNKIHHIIDPQNDIDLLSDKYRRHFFKRNQLIAQSPGVEFTDNWGHSKGDYLFEKLGGWQDLLDETDLKDIEI